MNSHLTLHDVTSVDAERVVLRVLDNCEPYYCRKITAYSGDAKIEVVMFADRQDALLLPNERESEEVAR